MYGQRRARIACVRPWGWTAKLRFMSCGVHILRKWNERGQASMRISSGSSRRTWMRLKHSKLSSLGCRKLRRHHQRKIRRQGPSSSRSSSSSEPTRKICNNPSVLACKWPKNSSVSEIEPKKKNGDSLKKWRRSSCRSLGCRTHLRRCRGTGRFQSATRNRSDQCRSSPEKPRNSSRQLHYSGSQPRTAFRLPPPRAAWQHSHHLLHVYHTTRRRLVCSSRPHRRTQKPSRGCAARHLSIRCKCSKTRR
mmetsp:Transcript_64293/g.192018  ORF Transcript_64293/g.192018 Transcript_64293/m.192018 type:complete len:249 (-) Transcript_64293:996-1742(-)